MAKIQVDKRTINQFHERQKDLTQKKDPARQKKLHELTSHYLQTTSEEERNQFSKDYMRTLVPIVDAVYIDFAMLYDIYLGALLLMHQDSESAFSYIVSQLPLYHNSLDGLHAPYFPDLQVSEEELIKYIQNNTDVVFLQSPPTSFWINLAALARKIHKENIVAAQVHGFKQRKVSYLINTYPFTPTVSAMKTFKIRFTFGIFQDAFDFMPFSCDPRSMEDFIYTVPKYYFMERFNDWLDEGSISQEKIKNGALEKAIVVAKPLVTEPTVLSEIYSYTIDQITELERNTTLLFNIFTEFHYYRPTVICFNSKESKQDKSK